MVASVSRNRLVSAVLTKDEALMLVLIESEGTAVRQKNNTD